MSQFWRPPLFTTINNGYCGCVVIVNNEPKYLPLTQVNAHATLLASTSRTALTQTFKNPTSQTLKESRYVFPLFDGVSVVAFTCTIGKTVIKGVVKSRPGAKKEFDAAVAQGQQAGLFEQSERASDVFTTTLGNVGPNEEAKVEITFLGELKHDAEVDGLRYTIPTNIAPRYADDLVLPIPDHQANVTTEEASLSVTIDVDLAIGSAIKSVQSPSHPISVKIGTTSKRPNDDPSLQYASASLTRSDVQLDKDFIVQVCAKGLGDPSAVLETHATIPSRRAIMATLVPRFNLAVEKPEVVFICDRSGSMDTGTRLPNLKSSLQVFLRSLPVGVLFNICSFGSSHSFLWPKSQPYSQKTLDEAAAHVRTFTANNGGTRIREPIEATFANREGSRNLEVFLMTDGETWDENATFEAINHAVKEADGAIRVFALGVGADASHSLIEGVARAGRGFAQSVGEDEKMNKKVVRMLKGALTPHVNDYSLEIKYEKDDDQEFELVEKVSECTVVDTGDKTDNKPAKTPIPLYDSSVKNDDLEMPDAQALPLPNLPAPTYLQAPYAIPPLFPFNRTSVYILLSEARAHRTPKSVLLKGTAPQGPLELEIPITAIADKGTTIHQLGARKAVQDLEEGRGWVYDAKLPDGKMLNEAYAARMSDVAREAAVKLGVEYQVAGKWCSFVAVRKRGDNKSTPDTASSSDVGASTLDQSQSQNKNDDSDQDESFCLVGDVSASLAAAPGGAPQQRSIKTMAARRAPMMMMHSMAAAASSPFAPMQASKAAAAASFGGASPYALDSTSHSLFGSALPAPQAAGFGGGGGGDGSPTFFGAPAAEANVATSGGLFGNLQSMQSRPVQPPQQLQMVQQQMAQQQLQQQQQQLGRARHRKAPSGQQVAFGNAQDEDDESYQIPTKEDAKTPLEAIIALQTFGGSWTWSTALEELLGVTREVAGKQLEVAAEEVAATVCAVAYLEEKLADEQEVWELVVDKAREWLSMTLGEDGVAPLEKRARQMLS
ncbi:von Willebrand domain containing protein [Beauveria brongniartii RCEF 3172]|uniref:von Willebrand domain containing protein n=1 Tax=Beauveria brongniartii RCEF 3172 TaxID=1081107 RepID=A0A166VYA7_9HYPO|nr:von Willebrand domain containing protein [Beauveria brongniartii RCEF 3172]